MGYPHVLETKSKVVRITPVLYTKVRQQERWEDEPFGTILERLLETVLPKKPLKKDK
jgi:hypothetical protein